MPGEGVVGETLGGDHGEEEGGSEGEMVGDFDTRGIVAEGTEW